MVPRLDHQLQAVESTTERSFLGQFPAPMRSHITNILIDVVHASADSSEVVIGAVAPAVFVHVHQAPRWRDAATMPKSSRLHCLLVERPYEAVRFVTWVLAWNALSRAENDAQQACLQRLGYAGPIKKRLHASELIDQITRGHPHNPADR